MVQTPEFDYTHALLTPGQGNQTVGMGMKLAERSQAANAIWQIADKELFPHLGRKLTDAVWYGNEDELQKTEFAQLSVVVDALARKAALEETRQLETPGWHAGLSVGLIPALINAGALSIESGVQLDEGRGEVFRYAIDHGPKTTLVALNDVEREILQELKDPEGRFKLVVCLVNSDQEVVMGGVEENVQTAVSYLKEERGLEDHVFPLKVDAAFHSEYMKPAVPRWTEIVMATPIEAPKYGRVMGGSRAKELQTPRDIQEELILQLTHKEKFRDVMWAFRARGVTTMTELNSARRLTRLNMANFRLTPQDRPFKALTLPDDNSITIGYRLVNSHPEKMVRAPIKDWYISWIADRVGKEPEDVYEEMHFMEGAGLDSIDLKALRAELKRKFGRIVPDDEAEENTHIYMAVDATYRLVNTPSQAV